MDKIGKIVAALCFCLTVGCGSTGWNPPPKDEDAGIDIGSDSSDPDTGGENDMASDSALLFFSVDDRSGDQRELNGGDEIELVAGFQGGWHLDLITKHPTAESPVLNGTQNVSVTIEGTEYHTASLDLDQRSFLMENDVATQRLLPLVLDITSADEVVSKVATISVTYSFDDGTILTHDMDVLIVDEFDEFGGEFG